MKSTRAFRTISEAADELELQPHVLRFWESKFPQIQPMKRRGGRRLYRPEDVEFLRGIKILLHHEKHKIKDVQKLIRIKGADSVMELGRSAVRAARPKDIKETVLVPERIRAVAGQRPARRPAVKPKPVPSAEIAPAESAPVAEVVRRPGADVPPEVVPKPVPESAPESAPAPVREETPALSEPNRESLEDALSRLKSLKSRWQKFQ